MFPPYQRHLVLQFSLPFSASMSNMAKIEEMERLLREAQAEKQRLLEHRVLTLSKTYLQMWTCVSNDNSPISPPDHTA